MLLADAASVSIFIRRNDRVARSRSPTAAPASRLTADWNARGQKRRQHVAHDDHAGVDFALSEVAHGTGRLGSIIMRVVVYDEMGAIALDYHMHRDAAALCPGRLEKARVVEALQEAAFFIMDAPAPARRPIRAELVLTGHTSLASRLWRGNSPAFSAPLAPRVAPGAAVPPLCWTADQTPRAGQSRRDALARF